MDLVCSSGWPVNFLQKRREKVFLQHSWRLLQVPVPQLTNCDCRVPTKVKKSEVLHLSVSENSLKYCCQPLSGFYFHRVSDDYPECKWNAEILSLFTAIEVLHYVKHFKWSLWFFKCASQVNLLCLLVKLAILNPAGLARLTTCLYPASWKIFDLIKPIHSLGKDTAVTHLCKKA